MNKAKYTAFQIKILYETDYSENLIDEFFVWADNEENLITLLPLIIPYEIKDPYYIDLNQCSDGLYAVMASPDMAFQNENPNTLFWSNNWGWGDLNGAQAYSLRTHRLTGNVKGPDGSYLLKIDDALALQEKIKEVLDEPAQAIRQRN